MKETQQQVRRIHNTLVGRMAGLFPQLSALALGGRGPPGLLRAAPGSPLKGPLLDPCSTTAGSGAS